MARKTNFNYEKRQKELARQAKQTEKLNRKQKRKDSDAEEPGDDGSLIESATPENPGS